MVYLDWQNIYMGARDAFDLTDRPPAVGNVDPRRLAKLLAAARDRTGAERELREVRIYRGRPLQQYDETSYKAFWAQHDAWKARGGDRLEVISRDLRYPLPAERFPGQERYRRERDGPPQEKGVDVALAIDLVALAIRKGADRAVVMSTDTDLLPAIELAIAERGEEFIEVAAWDEPPHRHAPVLRPKGASIAQRRIRRDHFMRIRDEVNYSLPKWERNAPSDAWDAQIEAEGRRRRPSR